MPVAHFCDVLLGGLPPDGGLVVAGGHSIGTYGCVEVEDQHMPDMPYGSPGMGSEDSRDAYDVVLIRRDGGLEVYTSYPAA